MCSAYIVFDVSNRGQFHVMNLDVIVDHDASDTVLPNWLAPAKCCWFDHDDWTLRMIGSITSKGSAFLLGDSVAVWSVKSRGSRLTST